MSGNANLKRGNPQTQFRSGREAVEAGRKGGLSSAKVRRLQGAIKRALDSSAAEREFTELFERFNIDGDERTYAAAIACALTTKAAKGDVAAAGFIRDSIGEKPKDELSVEGGVVILDDITNKA